MLRRPPHSKRTDTLFPYTTLFRSDLGMADSHQVAVAGLSRGWMLYAHTMPRGTQIATLSAQVLPGVWRSLLRLHENQISLGDLQPDLVRVSRSEEHTSELQSLMRISYAVFCLKKKNTTHTVT